MRFEEALRNVEQVKDQRERYKKICRIRFDRVEKEYICWYCNVTYSITAITLLTKVGRNKQYYYCRNCNNYYCSEHLIKCRKDHGYPYCYECRKDKNKDTKQKTRCICKPDCDVLIPITDSCGRISKYAPGHFKRTSLAVKAKVKCYMCHVNDATIASIFGQKNQDNKTLCCDRCYNKLKAKYVRRRWRSY